MYPSFFSFSFFLFYFVCYDGFYIPTSLSLSRDKTKGKSGKNTTLTPTKILSKKVSSLVRSACDEASSYYLVSAKGE